jgi:hypothetical protein
VTKTRPAAIDGVVKVGGSLFELDDWPSRLIAWLTARPRIVTEVRADERCGGKPIDTPRRVETWLLVAGGGPWIDTLRDWNARQALGEEACHGWCAKLLSVTADLALNRLLVAAAKTKRAECVASPMAVEQTGRGPSKARRATSWKDAVAVFPRVLPAAEIREFPRLVNAREASGPTANVSLGVIDSGEYLERASRRGTRRLPRDWTVSSDSVAAHLARRVHARTLVLAKSCPLPQTAATAAAAASMGLVDRHFPKAAAGLVSIQWLDLRTPNPDALQFQGSD